MTDHHAMAAASDADRLTPARRRHIYLLEARFQFVEVLREPMFAIPTLTFPLIFYLFFGVIMGARGASLAVPTYTLATYGVFGVLGPALFGFGAGLANERDTGVLLAGVIPFCALGLAIGAWSKGRAAIAVVNLVFLPMAMLSGLWLPIYMFPEVMQDIALALPAYHHAQLALKVIAMDGGQSVPLHLAVLMGETLVFLAVAGLGFRRAGGFSISRSR